MIRLIFTLVLTTATCAQAHEINTTKTAIAMFTDAADLDGTEAANTIWLTQQNPDAPIEVTGRTSDDQPLLSAELSLASGTDLELVLNNFGYVEAVTVGLTKILHGQATKLSLNGFAVKVDGRVFMLKSFEDGS